jgi:hypothetical protein
MSMPPSKLLCPWIAHSQQCHHGWAQLCILRLRLLWYGKCCNHECYTRKKPFLWKQNTESKDCCKGLRGAGYWRFNTVKGGRKPKRKRYWQRLGDRVCSGSVTVKETNAGTGLLRKRVEYFCFFLSCTARQGRKNLLAGLTAEIDFE